MTACHIDILALGPDGENQMMIGVLPYLRRTPSLFLRTEIHGAAAWLRKEGISYTSLDDCYAGCEDFEELCGKIAARLFLEAEKNSIAYAVPDPLTDATVAYLIAHKPENMTVSLLPGLSLADCALAFCCAQGEKTTDSLRMTALSLPAYRPQADRGQVITELNDARLASDVKLWLSDLFDDEMTVWFFENAASLPGSRIPLYALDRQKHYDHRSCVFIPPVSVFQRERATYEDFVGIIHQLRAPGGCPWDRAQTHHTLRKYMMEEACEAAEAMDDPDPMKLADELGDVLLQIVLNSEIAGEHRDFTDRDVTSLAAQKMIRRHAHVFGTAHADTPEETSRVWESVKKQERGEQCKSQRMQAVPVSLPALMRAQKVLKRQGLPERADAEKAVEEAFEDFRKKMDEENLGMLLEAVCMLAESAGLDGETALRIATKQRINGQIRQDDPQGCP